MKVKVFNQDIEGGDSILVNNKQLKGLWKVVDLEKLLNTSHICRSVENKTDCNGITLFENDIVDVNSERYEPFKAYIQYFDDEWVLSVLGLVSKPCHLKLSDFKSSELTKVGSIYNNI